MRFKVNKMKGEILTKRPEGMDYETYREKRKAQEKQIRDRIRKGYMVWPAQKGTLVGRVPELIFI